MFIQSIMALGLAAASLHGATVLEWDFSTEPPEWEKRGAGELFKWDPEQKNLNVTWDSSRTNSFFSVKLPRPVNSRDDFSCEFDLQLSAIEIGTTPGKPATFQIAVGFFNSSSSYRSNFFIGTGTDSTHGPQNLLEFNYFPDSGFGATVSQIVVSQDNQFAYGHNFPLELFPDDVYTLKMRYTSANRTVESEILRNGEPYGVAGDGKLRSVTLPSRFTDFSFDRFGISSYSDAGQNTSFGGSIFAQGSVDKVKLMVPSIPQPRLLLQESDGWYLEFTVPTEAGFSYQLESSSDLITWQPIEGIFSGEGNLPIRSKFSIQPGQRYFRVRVEPEN